jgi:hypothetical protein
VLAERMLDRARSGGDIRTAKVRRLKAAIRSRNYENELKLSVALDRLLATMLNPSERETAS